MVLALSDNPGDRTIYNMTTRGCRFRFALTGLALMMACAATALAQQQFELEPNDEWVQTSETDPSTAEGQLATIRRVLAEGEYRRAESLVDQWLERHPRHPLTPEAHLLRGDSFRDRGEFYQALFDYEFVARAFMGSEAFVIALEREYEVARLFAGGMKRKIWGMRVASTSEEAQELLIRIQERLPGSHLAEQAGMTLADFYFARGDMDLAVEAYTLFIENYPRSERLNDARRRLIHAHMASFKGPQFDAAGLYEARELLVRFQMMEPAAAQQAGADALLVRIDDSDAQKMLETAKWYLRAGNPISAELTIRRLVKRYPRSVATAEALRLVPTILRRLPESIRAQGPDYEALRAGTAQPASTPRTDREFGPTSAPAGGRR